MQKILFEEKGRLFLVMEYIDGGELFDKIASQENQVFGEAQAATYMQKLFSALNHMHRCHPPCPPY